MFTELTQKYPLIHFTFDSVNVTEKVVTAALQRLLTRLCRFDVIDRRTHLHAPRFSCLYF
jgi:hypothetical protein